ncbi:type IX secretion system protein PorQ [uncultured Bacteroides sp.]|uniref:type IX secretion system protein PorQ n=1 Tax=uncultured Bacteroides sp. TaxID=162156 RepID=UPI002AAB78D4|nr:type IX secretion system protein PorQ [uncultured Bacteroides sp.]
MKKQLLILLLFCLSLATQAQNGTSVFKFLELPFSSHASALGGDNISINDNDITMAIHNPALLSFVSDKTLNMNYMSYIDGVGVGSAAFSNTLGERSVWAVAAQYVNYGNFKETSAEDIELGTFSAKDMAFSGIYSYDLSDSWSGGVTTKMIYSTYEKYSSFAIGVDLGLNYYNENSLFSASIVARNLGGQIKAFDESRESLPVDLLVGITKRLSHAPFRMSVTMHNLTNWNSSASTSTEEKEKFSKKLMNHFIFGVDFLPTETTYVSLGYNCKRKSEMQVNGISGWSGMALGAGIQIKRLKIGTSYAKFHPSSSSLLFNFAMTL